MCCVVAELALTSETFSSAPHRRSLFVILTSETRDLLVPGAR